MKKKTFISRFFSTTPKKWKKIRNAAAGLLAGVAGIPVATALIPDIKTPEWYINSVWYIVAFLGLVIGYAQSKEEKK